MHHMTSPGAEPSPDTCGSTLLLTSLAVQVDGPNVSQTHHSLCLAVRCILQEWVPV